MGEGNLFWDFPVGKGAISDDSGVFLIDYGAIGRGGVGTGQAELLKALL